MPTPYLTLADVCHLYGISIRTARRWAQHDRWRRTSSKPRRYHAGDVQASYNRHQRKRLTHHRVKRKEARKGEP